MAEVGKTLQSGFVPRYASRIVRVGKDEEFALLISHLFEVVKVHLVEVARRYCTIVICSSLASLQWIVHDTPMVVSGNKSEGVVNRRLYDNLIDFLEQCSHYHSNSLHDARYVSHPFLLHIPLMVVFNPRSHSLPIPIRQSCVAEYRMVQSLLYGIDDEVWSFEVHVCHPHRKKVFSWVEFSQCVMLHGVCTSAVYCLVEIERVH